MPVELIGLIASLITGFQVVRQAIDMHVVKSPIGVAWGTWELALVQSLGLLILSIDQGLFAATLVNAWVGALCMPIIVRALGGYRSPALVRSIAAISVAIALCLAALLLFGPSAAGTVGSVASAFVWIPQAVRSYRLRSDRGLSWTVVLAGLTSSALWGTYAIMVDQWQLLVPPVSVSSAITCWDDTSETEGEQMTR